jgi:hypothetical protein
MTEAEAKQFPQIGSCRRSRDNCKDIADKATTPELRNRWLTMAAFWESRLQGAIADAESKLANRKPAAGN